MEILQIPTAPFVYFSTPKSLYRGHRVYDQAIFNDLPVLKYSGLAAGKGVYLPNHKEQINDDITQLFKLGDAGIIIEQRLYGTEVSVLAFL